MPGLFSREAHRRRLAAQVIAVLLPHGQQGFLETAGVFGATDPVQLADDLRPVTQRRIPHGKHDRFLSDKGRPSFS